MGIKLPSDHFDCYRVAGIGSHDEPRSLNPRSLRGPLRGSEAAIAAKRSIFQMEEHDIGRALAPFSTSES